jgi:hypothetical protein
VGRLTAAGKIAVRRTVFQGVTAVTSLYLPECAFWRLADEQLREALAGRNEVHVRHRLLTTPELVTTPDDATAEGFRGSPTVLIDGRDPFDDPAGLSCRVFPTGAVLSGAPTAEQLLAVMS